MRSHGQLLFLIFVLVCIIYVFQGFVDSMGPGYDTSSTKVDGFERVDAVVVLTGGNGRVDNGLRLLRDGRGGMLLLSGVDKSADIDSIFHGEVLDSLERISIRLEKRSGSTFENAEELRKIIEREGQIRTILLLTSNYHMPRAELIFNYVMPNGVSLQPYPVSSPNFDPDVWWKGKGVFIAVPEFLKFYWYSFRFDLIPYKG